MWINLNFDDEEKNAMPIMQINLEKRKSSAENNNKASFCLTLNVFYIEKSLPFTIDHTQKFKLDY